MGGAEIQSGAGGWEAERRCGVGEPLGVIGAFSQEAKALVTKLMF